MVRVLDMSRDDLLARRREILERLGVTYEDLLARTETGSLSGDEHEALEDLRDVTYLLGDE